MLAYFGVREACVFVAASTHDFAKHQILDTLSLTGFF